MTRGRRRTFATSPFEAVCWTCGERINDYRDSTLRKGKRIHKTCAPGADDV